MELGTFRPVRREGAEPGTREKEKANLTLYERGGRS